MGKAYRKLRTGPATWLSTNSRRSWSTWRSTGREFLVDPAFTPKACAECGHVGGLTLSGGVFACHAVGQQTGTTALP